MRTLLRDVEVEGVRTDVVVDGALVTAVGPAAPTDVDEVVEGAGSALLPGLHDHHLHLLAMAAAEASIDVSRGLHVLRDRPGKGWIRAVGWAGDGDRHDLDAVVGDRPVRVQHRSGALWVLSTAGLRLLGPTDHPGVERDAQGEPTGRLWRADDLLAERLGRAAPDLGPTVRRLAALGITGVTDATPDLDEDTCRLLRASVPQRLLLLGDPHGHDPVKLVLPDHSLPALDDLVHRIRSARPRPVAVHCVTREALVLLLTALDVVGRQRGDRVEHGAVVPLDVADQLPPVVTQPAFVAHRGDDYLRDVDPSDQPDLYRYGSLLSRGCAVVPSSDAPFGPLDPWQVLRAARDRLSPTGRRVGDDPGVAVAIALAGMLVPLEDLRGAPRRVQPGVPADLVLLHAPLEEVLREPDASLVRRTWLGGKQLS